MTAGSDTGSAAPARARPRLRRHTVALAAAVVLTAAVYAVCSLRRYATFQASTYDLVIFDQAVRSYSHFDLPVSIAKGVHNGFGPSFSVLGDHLSPLLALLAPLYWLHDGPQTLLVAQAVLLAATIVPLWCFARRELGVPAAYLVALGYALSWPVAEAVTFDFHEVAFAPVLTAVLFERLSAARRQVGSWWHIAVAAVALACVKEDTGLLVAGVGLGLCIESIRPSPRRGALRTLGIVLTVGGVLWTVVAIQAVIPALGGRAGYYWAYNQLGDGILDAAWSVVTDPARAVRLAVEPDVKVSTLLWLGAVAPFTPLLSPYLLAPLPLLAERMLADAPAWWGLPYHYNAFLVVPVLCAGVDGARRLGQWTARRANRPPWLSRHVGVLWCVAVAIVAIAAVPMFPVAELARTGTWRTTDDQRAARGVVSSVPIGSLVEAVNLLGPHLSGNHDVLLWDRVPRWAPYVVADTERHQFPFCSLDEQRQRVQFLRDHGYVTVAEQHGYVVLYRGGPPPQLGATISPGCP